MNFSHSHRDRINIRNLSLAAAFLALSACQEKNSNGNLRENPEPEIATIPDSQFPEDIQRIAKGLHLPAYAVAEVRNLPAEELQRMSEAILNHNNATGDYTILLAAEDLVAGIFIDSLRKPDAFAKRSGVLGDYDCRAHQALSFLKEGVHPPLIPVLKEVLRRGDLREIKIISFALASFSNMEVLDETSVLLRHQDPQITVMARLGVLTALQKRQVSAEFRTAIWPACEASFLACEGDITRSRDAARLLVALNKEKAAMVFQSSGVLDVGHPLLEATLDELIRSETPPDESLLLAVLDKNDYDKIHVQKRLHALALIGLAQRNSSQAEERIARVLASDQRQDDTLGVAAWKARFKLAGRTPLVESAIDAYFEKDHKIENLNTDERRVWLISAADTEFSNGGSTQWFENRHGAYTSETLEALRHFRMAKHAEILKEINDILSPTGSVQSYDERQNILQRLTDQSASKLDRLTDQWYKLPTWEIFVHEWDWEASPAD